MKRKSTKDAPLYLHSAAYAREHDELPQYRQSCEANVACKTAIEKAIYANYADNCLNSPAILEAVSAEFRMERIQYVLANSVRVKEWDARISPANKEWAQTVSIVPNPDAWGNDRNCYFVLDQAHPGLVNQLISHFRREMEKVPKGKKPSVLKKLAEPLPDAVSRPDKDKAQEL